MADSVATPGGDVPAPGEQGERALHVALKHLAAMPHSAFACSADADVDAFKDDGGVDALIRLRDYGAAGEAQACAVACIETVSRAFRDAARSVLPAPVRAATRNKTVHLRAILATAHHAGILQCKNVQRVVKSLCDAPPANDARCAELARASSEALRSRRYREHEALIEQRAALQALSDDVPDAAEEVRRWRSECFVSALEGKWNAS